MKITFVPVEKYIMAVPQDQVAKDELGHDVTLSTDLTTINDLDDGSDRIRITVGRTIYLTNGPIKVEA